MSRATTIGPVSDSRVLTGYSLSSARISLIGRHRSIRHHVVVEVLVGGLGQVLRRVGLQLLQEHARPR